jgi:tRNA(Ile)-lysidine synthase
MKTEDPLYIRFLEFISKQGLFDNTDRILLAVSGGMDSMVMTSLFHASVFRFALAHCNFQLRGEDAAMDQKLVEETARNINVPFFTTSFDTLSIARDQHLSVQMAARKLRYDWLEETRKKQLFNYVATAHHLDDSIETLIINLSRGTGIGGLTGIPRKNQHLVRPLLFASREEIRAYAREHKIMYREDQSNNEQHYIRNKIRHTISPRLEEINPSFRKTLSDFFDTMEATQNVYKWAIKQQKLNCIRLKENETEILTSILVQQPEPESLLFEILREYNFSPKISKEIFDRLYAQSGKHFFSESHILLKDRDKLLIYPRKATPAHPVYYVEENTRLLDAGESFFRFHSLKREDIDEHELNTSPETVFLDQKLLQFPLLLRRWKPGDRFTPLGMNGSKKISDLLTEKKVPRHKKSKTWVLVSAGTIVWVAGIRSDQHHKVSNATKQVFTASVY